MTGSAARKEVLAISGIVVLCGAALFIRGYFKSAPQSEDGKSNPSVASPTGAAASQPDLRTAGSPGNPSSSPPDNDAVSPLADIDSIVRGFEDSMVESRQVRLARMELELRENLKNGWKPPWSNLSPDLAGEKLKSMPTDELGRVCFSGGLPARTLLLYDDPIFGIKRLEVLYPPYGEFLNRKDSWKGLAAAFDTLASQLDFQGESVKNVNAFMGLATLPELYLYPQIHTNLAGHQRELIAAHISALKKLQQYYESAAAAGAQKPFAAHRTAVMLVQWALVLERDVSPEAYARAVASIKELKLDKEPTNRDVAEYIAQAVRELDQFAQ